jgi:hypothetical protein
MGLLQIEEFKRIIKAEERKGHLANAFSRITAGFEPGSKATVASRRFSAKLSAWIVFRDFGRQIEAFPPFNPTGTLGESRFRSDQPTLICLGRPPAGFVEGNYQVTSADC